MGIDPTALPNFLKNINPVDLLKIIPLLIGNPMQQMADAGAATKHLQIYQGKGGSLKHHSPEMRRLILNENVRKYQA